MLDAWIYYNLAAVIWAFGIVHWKIKGLTAKVGFVIFMPQVAFMFLVKAWPKEYKNGKLSISHYDVDKHGNRIYKYSIS